MNNLMNRLSKFAPAILRLGLTAVIAWFGFSQIISPNSWVGIVPDWATSLTGMNALTIVHVNAWFEIITALLLGIGIWTRWVALLLSIHIFIIATSFGLNPTGIRDFGLSFSLLALSLFGSQKYCFDYKESN